ncbi:sporulation protein [Nocardiopsis changdeensis]|uniref:Sporulation protein n=1 Tax=Nocardiopsis changdeensis TaxID=2831969 RepID=A0ABX8BM93_9ACTN|nr:MULTISPECIES: sporulation protein [Nocardiopsis]QUX22424.1 sporulation protein [Nocardiopsis changdeensis]QYX38366.1 sporulation protein [Nocardiopsis sp. MT53]
MVFRYLLSVLGTGCPKVDTVLDDPHRRPGELLQGRLELTGGELDWEIAEVAHVLVARFGDGEESEFARVPLMGAMTLDAERRLVVPFAYRVPWAAPPTRLDGTDLAGVELGLRTDVVIDDALDEGDLDPVHVHPLPLHERLLEGMESAGFERRGGHAARGGLPGDPGRARFHRALRYTDGTVDLDLLLSTAEEGVAVAFAADGMLAEYAAGRAEPRWFHARHEDADREDWRRRVGEWIGYTLDRDGDGEAYARKGGAQG